jgi:4-hydroxybenzoate polyprenyltransferase
MNQKDIDDLEKDLKEFVSHWQREQQKRISTWRRFVLIAFVVILGLVFLLPRLSVLLWWLSIVFIGFSAGYLYKIINDDAKTNYQVLEHKKQLKLARALLHFDVD